MRMGKLPVKINNCNREGTNFAPTHANPDPFVLRWKNKYFCYSTGVEGIHVLVSECLKEFQEAGYAYCSEEEYSFWAPAVFYWKGKFYLYYSSLKRGETDDHLHFLRVAVADNPLGPFTWKADLTDYFAIDPHVIIQEEHLFIFFAANIQENCKNGRSGTVIWMDELDTPYKMSGNAQVVLLPTIDEEIFAKNRFGDGRDWHTLEGPCFLSDGEWNWILYSGNAYTSPDYFVGYAAGKNVLDLRNTAFVKQPDEGKYVPLLHAGNGVEGTGHNSVTQAPDHITPVIVYHGRKTGEITDETQDDRKMYLDYIWRDGNEIKTNAPAPQEIMTFPEPNLHYLRENESLKVQYEGNGYLNKGNYEIELSEKRTFYLEICVRVPEGGVQIYENAGERVLLTLEGDYWQHGGILLTGEMAHCRYGEEWRKPVKCGEIKKIELRVTGKAFIEYFDCTFLQHEGGDTPKCLL